MSKHKFRKSAPLGFRRFGRVRVAATFSAEEFELLRTAAQKADVSLSEMVRRAVVAHLGGQTE
jgi:hypothetical protein